MQKEVVQSSFTNMFDTFDGYNIREKIWTSSVSLENIKSCQSIKLQNFKHIYYVLNKISSPQSNLSRQNN